MSDQHQPTRDEEFCEWESQDADPDVLYITSCGVDRYRLWLGPGCNDYEPLPETCDHCGRKTKEVEDE